MLPKKHIIYNRVHVSPDVVSYNKGMRNRGVPLIITVPPPYIISYSYGLIRYSCILNRSN